VKRALPLACLGLALVAGCIEPGSIADPDAILARIGSGDGGPFDADGGAFPVPGIDAGGSSDGCGDVLASYVTPTCATPVCHGTGAPNVLDLGSPMHAERLVGTEASSLCPGELLIDPATPEESLLYTKLDRNPPCGSPMPYLQAEPSEAQKACMLSWLRELIAATGGTDAGMSGTPDAGNGGAVDSGRPDAGADCATRDTDNDGTDDCDDICPNDPNKTTAGLCGCGMPDTDGDGDGLADCDDGCPSDANKTSPGQCGCGMTEGDSDGDGTADCNDGCPNDANKTAAGTCGCGTPDTDTDADGTPACNDACDNNADVTAAPCNGPGLLEGRLTGAFNLGGSNNGREGIDPLGPTRSEILDLPENTTYVLTGEIYVPASGVLSFYENFDDSVYLAVDGQEILNDEVWDVPTAGSITRAEGWYSFELRLGNGAQGSGPPTGIGFGYASVDTGGSTDPAMYTLPRNSSPTSGDLFRVP
jgi:hypothetical protein